MADMPASGGYAIRTHEVTRCYGAVIAVAGVSLSVGRGEIYGLLGRNGAGKTTLIRLLLGMIRPTRGAVEVLGEPVRRQTGVRLWARVGYLVESPGLYPDLTVRDHLRIAVRYRRLPVRQVHDTADRLDLMRYAGVPARQLSHGNKQRLGLALSLAHRPDLLILDEPVNGLDPAGVVEVRELLRGLAGEGVTVFMSTHLIGEVAKLADRVGIVHAGRMVEELSAQRLRAAGTRRLVAGVREAGLVAGAVRALRAAGLTVRASGTTLTFTDPGAVQFPDKVSALLVAAGAPPTSLTVEREDLEAHFLRLTGGPADPPAGGWHGG